MARYIVFDALANAALLDDEGNWNFSEDKKLMADREKVNLKRFKYLNFRYCEELRSISFRGANDMFTANLDQILG